MIILLTGLPCSGKTTLAEALQVRIEQTKCAVSGRRTCILDGDVLRRGLTHDLGFSDADRREQFRRTFWVAQILQTYGVLSIMAIIAPFADSRAEGHLAEPVNFFEIYVRCPVDVCAMRDVKGNYKRAAAGALPNFTGVSAPFEEPEEANLIVDTNIYSVEECVDQILKLISS